MQPSSLAASNARLKRSSLQVSGDEIRQTRKINAIENSYPNGQQAAKGWCQGYQNH
jgi:hypothetical protein